MKKKRLLLAPILGLLFTLFFFLLMNRTTANAPPSGIVQGNIQPQATNPFFTLYG